MSTHVNLVDMRIGSGIVSAPSTTLTVRGVMYTMPLPAHQINGSTVVFPAPEPDEETNSIRVRFDQWRIGRDVGPWRQLPLHCPDMAAAVKVAMEFESDPGISWDSSEEDLGAWAVAFVERDRARSGGDR
ncbi:hypothetical protein AB0L88_01435 [Saccharopolyspora shandongensis]|uniref:hypothetical protein n=1 Tax=Saccharopolyspora shandongensis TaxID=418495 RepID=UPI0034404E66